jgi:hypothetical protein
MVRVRPIMVSIRLRVRVWIRVCVRTVHRFLCLDILSALTLLVCAAPRYLDCQLPMEPNHKAFSSILYLAFKNLPDSRMTHDFRNVLFVVCIVSLRFALCEAQFLHMPSPH